MFYECNKLNKLDIYSFDTINVTNMSYMFFRCKNLKYLNFITFFDTRNVTDMSHMFQGCNKLKYLDLSLFDTRRVSNMSHMFHGCKSLTILDLASFKAGNVIDMTGMFYDCNNLNDLYLFKYNNSENNSESNSETNNETQIDYLDFYSSYFNEGNYSSVNENIYDTGETGDTNQYIFDNYIFPDMSDMFHGCSNLLNIDLSFCKFVKISDIRNIFHGCKENLINSFFTKKNNNILF